MRAARSAFLLCAALVGVPASAAQDKPSRDSLQTPRAEATTEVTRCCENEPAVSWLIRLGARLVPRPPYRLPLEVRPYRLTLDLRGPDRPAARFYALPETPPQVRRQRDEDD